MGKPMSMHKIPLTEIEESGLVTHHMPVGVPSILSDAFRLGVAWGQKAEREIQGKTMRTVLGHKFKQLSNKEITAAIEKASKFGGHPNDNRGAGDTNAPKMSVMSAVWSILETVDIMDETAINGKHLKLIYKDHWGPEPVVRELPENPTWNDLLFASDVAISLSGDKHHIYVENFYWKNDDPSTKTLFLSTGS